MQIEPWGWIAIVIVCILVFTWIFTHLGKTGYLPDGVFKDTYDSMIVSAHRNYDKYFESPEHLYTKTIGYQDDETVQMALTKAERKDLMHTKHENTGLMTRKNVNDAAVNAFIIGDLYRYNVAPGIKDAKKRNTVLSKAADYYGKALRRISLMPKSVVSENKDQSQPPVEEMVDRVENFYEQYLDQLEHLGIHNQNDFQEVRDGIRDARVAQARENAENPTTVPPTQTQRTRASRRNPKKHEPGTTMTQIAREEYFEERDIRSAPQNVHDTELTNEMLNIYKSIVNANNRERNSVGSGNYQNPSLEHVRRAIRDHKWEPLNNDPNGSGRRSRALRIVDLASQGNVLSQLDNAAEDDVLLNVWSRINSSDNEENRDSLKESLMDSLANSMDTNWAGEYKEVCIGGRCARMIGSLTLLDKEPTISSPMKTGEILRNEVFSKSYVILQDQLNTQPQEIQDAYNGKITEINDNLQSQVDRFESETKEKIAETIRNDYPSSKPDVLNNLIADAQAGI